MKERIMNASPLWALAALGLFINVSCARVAVAPPPAPLEEAPVVPAPATTPAPEPLPKAEPKVELPAPVVLDGNVLKFVKSNWKLVPQGQVVVEQAAEWLRLHGPGITLAVTGYSSKGGGSSSQNLEASRHRAEFVAKALIKAGVSSDKIFVRGRGAADPCASNATHAGRLKNERVEVSFHHGEGIPK
jgi:OOP family OmpA-OmpF porin